MSLDTRELARFGKSLEKLRGDIPSILEELAVGEGVYAVRQARDICKQDGIVNNGTYRMNFHAGDKAVIYDGEAPHDGSRPRRAGKAFKIDIYNNLDYAKHLEYGFRSHFVPGYWEGHTFVYQPGFPGGMYVGPRGGFVQGHFTLLRALRRTQATQEARMGRKFNEIIKNRLGGEGS